MRKITTILFCSLLLFSCKEKKKQTSQTPTKPEMHKEQYGSYIGIFSDYDHEGDIRTTISLQIKMITEDGVQGYSIVKGNKRQFTGQIVQNGNAFVLDLKEPGDKNSDGIYHLTITGDSINGTWKPLLADSKLKTKDIQLVKKKFEYNPELKLELDEDGQYIDSTSHKDSVIHPYEDSSETETVSYYRSASDAVLKLNASTDILSESQLKNLKKLDLEIIKNNIYARHGFAFKTEKARQFFDFQSWYIPIYDDVEDQLTKTERSNIETINRFIKYAADNYNTFGR